MSKNTIDLTEELNLSLPQYLKKAKSEVSKTLKTSSLKFGFEKKNLLLFREGDKSLSSTLKKHLHPWQLKKLAQGGVGVIQKFETSKGELAVGVLKKEPQELHNHQGITTPGHYTQARDLVGSFVSTASLSEKGELNFFFFSLDEESLFGSMVGVEMGLYDFKDPVKKVSLKFHQIGGSLSEKEFKSLVNKSGTLGEGVNISRHLVDSPSANKRPLEYSEAVKNLFKGLKNTEIKILGPKEIIKEKMGLLWGVGKGAINGPQLVHIKYRPSKGKKGEGDKKPLAFVGKGVTFDSGGLNIKPSGAMRNMKKDMGGSAALVGLAYWTVTQKLNWPCDFYLSLAENAVDKYSMRPGDILTARNGMTVEIDNTDAEGRLVMADALDYALTKNPKEKPQAILDISTLTGAIKVGLGSGIGGLFSNNDNLAELIQDAGRDSGDRVWRMPLLPEMKAKLNSNVATMVNSASGFGGAITAALFLQSFVGETPWAHMDIYAWTDSGTGPYKRAGANGQGVQCLSRFLTNWEQLGIMDLE